MMFTEKILNYTRIYWNFDVKIPLISVLPWRMFTFQKGSLRNKQLSVNEPLTSGDSSLRLKIIRLNANARIKIFTTLSIYITLPQTCLRFIIFIVCCFRAYRPYFSHIFLDNCRKMID